MKLITKIYLAVGFVLLLFTSVTLSFLWHTNKEDYYTKKVIRSMEILNLSESMEKSIVDMQTSLRGYIITGNEALLAPYYDSYTDWQHNFNKGLALTDNPESARFMVEIGKLLENWKRSIADEIIAKKLYLQENNIQKEARETDTRNTLNNVKKGDKQIALIRQKFITLNKLQIIIKEKNIRSLEKSLSYTRYISVGLTAIGIILAILTALLIANTLRRRLYAMVNLAESISHGNFEVHISEKGKDEMSRLARSLNRMTEKLQFSFNNITKVNRELDQFAYVVSHDLKAPLRAINNLAEWISEDITDQNPEIQHNLQLMRGRVLRMENLINGILAYSKVDRKEIEPETFEVKQLLEEVVDLLAPPDNTEIVLPQNAPTVTTEKILLQQVFSNLISNAIKYNNKPMCRVVILARETGEFHEFSVTDNGPGIAEQFHQKVFGIFQTMESRDTKESTGVGLAIVKKIIDDKGGSIRINSRENEFTSFIFTWPKNEPVA